MHFPRVESHDRFRGGHELVGEGRRQPVYTRMPAGPVKPLRVAPALLGTEELPGSASGHGSPRIVGAVTGIPSRCGFSARVWWVVPGPELSVGRWRHRRHSTRPVLKHGPRSLACARVNGSYETPGRSESEDLLGMVQVGSAFVDRSFSFERVAHHRPAPSALSVGRSRSAYAGTRKMVNYA